MTKYPKHDKMAQRIKERLEAKGLGGVIVDDTYVEFSMTAYGLEGVYARIDQTEIEYMIDQLTDEEYEEL